MTFERETFDNDYLQAEEIEHMAQERALKSFELKIAHQEQIILKIQKPSSDLPKRDMWRVSFYD